MSGLFSAQLPSKQAVIDEIIHDEDNRAIAAELLSRPFNPCGSTMSH